MTRIYENQGFLRRTNISIGILILVFFYGLWELYSAFVGGSEDPMGALFGILFVGGSLYGAKSVWDDSRNLVAAIDEDPASGRVAVTFWRPFSTQVVATDRAGMGNWRHWVKVVKRGLRSHQFVGNVAGWPDEVTIDLGPPDAATEGLRRLLPAAARQLDENTGRTEAPPPPPAANDPA